MSFLLRPSLSARLATPSLKRTFTSTSSRNLARMTIIGRLGTDPELSETSRGPLVKYILATNYGPKDNRQTSWFRCVSFAQEGPARDYVMGLTRGTLVYFEGDATLKTYEDSQGKKQSSLSLVQTKVEVLKRPAAREESETEGEGQSS